MRLSCELPPFGPLLNNVPPQNREDERLWERFEVYKIKGGKQQTSLRSSGFRNKTQPWQTPCEFRNGGILKQKENSNSLLASKPQGFSKKNDVVIDYY